MPRFCFVVIVALFSVVLSAASCWNKPLTSDEAKVSVDEITLSSQALNLVSGSMEIATDFTIGEAVENVAQEIKEFIESQLPCASITLSGATLTIEYGVNPGECTYNGNEYSGKHTITIKSTEPGNIVVEHSWLNFNNESISVTGGATVTWSSAESSRRIEHSLEFTRFSDGKTATTTGVRTQTALAEGLGVGIGVDGSVDWITKALDEESDESEEDESKGNEWNLDIDNVEMRWIDPVPQSGTYTLDTPFDKSATITFERVDEDTIAVIVSSGDKSFTFKVSKAGAISEE